ncbi:MAG TPA: hypothetical protein ENI06_05850 [Spirochaetales bacterium]|nr:hypothetical protein [Spirochaetales bacterium]
MVLVIGQNSTWQKTCLLPQLKSGEVNRIDRVIFGAAGKGANVARGLKLLAKKPHLLGYTGGINGDRFINACKSEGLESSFIPLEHETRICTTIIESSGRTTELIEPSPVVSDQEIAAFKQEFQKKIPAAVFLAITGTALPAEPDECYKDYLIQAKSHNVPVLLDSYRRHGARALEAAPEILKVNLQEVEELAGEKLSAGVSKVVSRFMVYNEMIEKFGIRWIIITKGAEGAEGCDGSKLVRVSLPDVKAVNPIGSGDAFSAGIIASVLDEIGEGAVIRKFPEAFSLERALKWGAAMGTANCLNINPGFVELTVLEKIFERVVVERREK